MSRALFRTVQILRLASLISLAALLCACQLPMFLQKEREPEIAQNPCIVLALPASGPYSPIASKIKRGAEIARLEQAKAGVDVRIAQINTEAPDWLTQLAALPPSCAVVGGPLQDKSYLEARKAGLLEQRAFFAFVPTLSQGDEGARAWRFFPSPQDQVEALINFTTDQMGIRSYGAMYPDDNYGRRMTEIMASALQKRHIPMQRAAYKPGSQITMQTTAQNLVNPKPSPDGKTRIPQTVFEALFVPDSWKNMDMITQSLLNNGEDRLALLGTTLWEQGLAGKQVPRAEKFSLAVFPAAWDQGKAPNALKSKNNDFWSALGYDFLNFGARVALAMRPQAQQVTMRAQKAASSIHAIAPMFWEDNGIAHQRLYLFQVTPGGQAPLQAERFRQARQAISERAALRMQGWGHIDATTGEALPAQEETQNEAAGADTAPEIQPVSSQPEQAPFVSQPPENMQAPHLGQTNPGPGVMSDKPRSSYKLSLPGKK